MKHIFFILICLLEIIPLQAQTTLKETIMAQMSVSQQKKDLNTLYSHVKSIHAAPFNYISEQSFDALKDSIEQTIVEESSQKDFYLKVAPLLASIRDGHATFGIPTKEFSDYCNQNGKVLPFSLKLDKGKILVDFCVSAESFIQKGYEVLSINGVKNEEIVARMYALVGSEYSNQIKEKSLNGYFVVLYWMLYGSPSTISVEYREADGKISQEVLPCVEYKDYMLGMRRNITPARTFAMKLGTSKRARLDVPNFYREKELKTFCDSIFPILSQKQIKELEIDVCDNSGGSSSCVDLLLSYITHPRYQLFHKSVMRVSALSKEYMKQYHPDIYANIADLADGTLYEMTEKSIPNNHKDKSRFKGRIFVKVNEGTYSGASTFAHAVANYKIGKTEGQTGCPTVYSGNYLSFQLPESKLTYYIPFCLFFE